MSKIKTLSAKLDDLIQFQTSEEVDAARRRHLKRTALIGAGAGAASLGGVNYLLTHRYLGRKLGAAAAVGGGIKGGLYGGATGLGIGLLTRPKKVKRTEEFSAKLDDLIEFAVDPRQRNELGEYSNEPPGPDPNAMEKTYRSGLHKGILEGGATAAIGGTSGVLATGAVKNIAARLKAVRKGKASRIIRP
jgi:hypothetical protein